MSLADGDTKSILTDTANKAIQGMWQCSSQISNQSSAIWWQNLQLMQAELSGGQIWNQRKCYHPVVKFGTNSSVLSGKQI